MSSQVSDALLALAFPAAAWGNSIYFIGPLGRLSNRLFSALIRSLCSLPAGPTRHSSICCCHVPGSHRSDSSNFTEFSARSQTLRFASVESSPLCGGPLLDTHPVCGSGSLSLVGPRPSRILLWFSPRDGVLIQKLLRPSRSEGFANVTRRFPMRQIVPGRPE